MLFVSNQKAYVETQKQLAALIKIYKEVSKGITVVVCPSFAHLAPARDAIRSLRKKNIVLGAQNMSAELSGAHTGDVPIEQLQDALVRYIIIGHSEVRAKGETLGAMRKKIDLCLKNKITPIICLGESVRDEQGKYVFALEHEVKELFSGYSKRELEQLVICYEPVWAISTHAQGVCTPEHFEEAVRAIKKTLHDMTGNTAVGKLTFIYGGSVNAQTIVPFFESELCEGFLVGSASVEPKALKELLARF